MIVPVSGTSVAEQLKALGWKQADLVRRSGIGKDTICSIIRSGAAGSFRHLGVVTAIAQAMNVDVQKLLLWQTQALPIVAIPGIPPVAVPRLLKHLPNRPDHEYPAPLNNASQRIYLAEQFTEEAAAMLSRSNLLDVRNLQRDISSTSAASRIQNEVWEMLRIELASQGPHRSPSQSSSPLRVRTCPTLVASILLFQYLNLVEGDEIAVNLNLDSPLPHFGL